MAAHCLWLRIVSGCAYAESVSSSRVVRVEKLVAGGDGLVREEDGRVIFVSGVLPNELVEIDVVEERRDFARGHLLAVVEPSPDRQAPPCPYVAQGCGGCDWQHIDRHVQGQIKRDIVREAFARTARTEIDPLMRRLSPEARRTTVRMVAQGGSLGFRRGESHEVVFVDRCLAAHDSINALIAAPVMQADGEVTIRTSVATGDVALWCHEGRVVDGLTIGGRTVPTGRRVRLTEKVGEHDYDVSMESFFQSSPEAAALIVDSVRRRLDTARASGGRLVDAYGGVGLFAKAFADRFDDLMVVESSESACRDAIRNLEDHAAVVDNSAVEQWDPVDAAVVIADPSRQGLGRSGVATIVETDADVVVLVSCDPVAGARDARYLMDAGYDIREVEVLDIFPDTHHVEVVTLFIRRPE